MTSLKADTRYRAKIQTVNEFGASKWSEEYEFDTYGGLSRVAARGKVLTKYYSVTTPRPSLFSAFSSGPSCCSDSFVLLMILMMVMVKMTR